MKKPTNYPIINAWAKREIKKAMITALIIGSILLTILLFATSCRPDYSNKPQKFHVGDKVKLDGINPRKSFVPYDCCDCPCIVTDVYTKQDNYHWYYAIKDMRDSTLINLTTDVLKKY